MAENRIHVIIKNNDSMNPVLVEREMQMAELKKLPIGIEDFEEMPDIQTLWSRKESTRL
ncbi:hypothetical protein [Agathobacter sp.]|uniref:hypothetical protein n=1 Tax=Agathobacter sp. TaxID=2021311 RepID=UPI002E7651A3|nr:hypothetical protein [Agathobacter sp.]